MRWRKAAKYLSALYASSLLIAASYSPANGSSCGGPQVCETSSGDYRIEIPQDGDVRGAYVFFHGFKGSAQLQMQQRYLVDTTLAHHLAFVAVDGIEGNWSFPNGARAGRDDERFVSEVLEDLSSRFHFTPKNTIIGGFSIGASMAYYAVCHQGDLSAALITFSGVFWNPLPKPEDCIANLPPMIHFHGTADRTFPLIGRQVGPRAHQGDTFQSIAIMRERQVRSFSSHLNCD